MHPDFKFRDRVTWAEGVEHAGEGGQTKVMEWGAWFELNDDEEDITSSSQLIPFFGVWLSYNDAPLTKANFSSE